MSSIPIIETVVSVITRIMRWAGYPGLFGLMAVDSFGIPPLPGEVILVFAGFLVGMGFLSYGAALVTAVLGALLGAFSAYAIGRWGRDWISTRAPVRLRIDPRHLARLDQWFARWGDEIVAVARLIPLARAYVSYPAGTAEMPPAKFGAYTLLGTIPFVAVLVYAGVLLGSRWHVIVPYFGYADDAVIAAIAVFLVWLFLRWHRDSRATRAPPNGGPVP